jgi:crotonobetainyl-CoA:carnitine CoA-transferase CaiB-like acyl-CoA transferase
MILHDGAFRTVAAPLRANGERLAMHLRPPALGEHSRAVLGELGYDNHKIDALIADGVVGSAGTA